MNQMRYVRPSFMWLLVIMGASLSFLFVGWQKIFTSNSLYVLLFFFTACYWLFMFISAWSVHRQALRNADNIDHIISVGIYRRLRHPMYSSDILLAWGFFLYIPSLSIFVAVLWLSLVLLFWAKWEEKAMIKKFGDAYRRYQAITPMLIPSLKKRINYF